MTTALGYRTVTVANVMHRGVVTCGPNWTLPNVARVLVAHRIHCVVVWSGPQEADEDGTLWGVVSDLDVARAMAAGASGLPAEVVASSPVTVRPDDTVERAAELMVAAGSTHLVVVRRGKPIGVVSTLDLAGALADA